MEKKLAKDSTRRTRDDLLTFHPDQPRASSPINDNYCVKVLRDQATNTRKDNELSFIKDTCKLFCCKNLYLMNLGFHKRKI